MRSELTVSADGDAIAGGFVDVFRGRMKLRGEYAKPAKAPVGAGLPISRAWRLSYSATGRIARHEHLMLFSSLRRRKLRRLRLRRRDERL